jgi:hypothetical protein
LELLRQFRIDIVRQERVVAAFILTLTVMVQMLAAGKPDPPGLVRVSRA